MNRFIPRVACAVDARKQARARPSCRAPFGELASGRISLSVALLLKPVLTSGNHVELIAAAGGASLRTARELLAARFPSRDVASRIRKLPERLGANAIPAGDVANAMPKAVGEVVPACVTTPRGTSGTTSASAPTSSLQPPRSTESELGSLAEVRAQSSFQAPATRYADPRPQQRIDPLSAERYRIVFTADASLKQKLELARDLLRHSHPSGDFALIVSRALDLLLQDLLQRRFGARRKETSHRAARAASQSGPTAAAAPTACASSIGRPLSSTLPVSVPEPKRPVASVAPGSETASPSTLPATTSATVPSVA